MRNDLLKAIAASKDVTNAIILTYNIDFVFLQTLVLGAFRRCGHPTITVFTDAQCAAESFSRQAPLLDGLGVRYRVVPVAMSPGYRFHPKAVLLSSEKDATLFVGSGNLTFGGWRENAEVWMRFDASVDGAAVFHEFDLYARQILERVPLAEAIAEELAEASDATNRPWLTHGPISTSRTLLGRVGEGAPLLESFHGAQGAEPVDELVVCSPYFDPEGSALHALVGQAMPGRATVLCQPSRSTLTRVGFAAAGEAAHLQQVSFEHRSVDEQARTAFIHAKFYGLLSGDQALVIAGSANCSRAALLSSGSDGNAELMAVRRMPIAEFESSLVGELQRIAAPVLLAEAVPAAEEAPVAPSIRVLAARFETGSLRVGFDPPRAQILACELDATKVRFSLSEPGILRVACSAEPRALRIEGIIDGVTAWSAPAWIDHERQLRASARGRGLIDIIRARTQPGGWNVTAWADIMDEFCKHLAYLPALDAGRVSSRAPSRERSAPGIFSFTDVFASSYEVPALSGLGSLLVKLEDGKERSLQKLLLRWFGILEEADDTETGVSVASDEGEDEVDRPEVLRVSLPPTHSASPTEADKRRAQKVLAHIEQAMTMEQFLARRRPEVLAADLKLAAVLLRTGLREHWIEPPDFFRTTHVIWASLFFSGSPETNQGWLEYRLRCAEDPAAFVAAMRSPELSAALLGWAFAAAPDEVSPSSARFHLAVALAVARLPWLWDSGDEKAVARELEVLLAHTGKPEEHSAALMRAAWERMLRTGHALMRLEGAASAVPLDGLRARIQAPALRTGDLLWQGGAGYCVVTKTTPRVEKQKVPVLRLQDGSEESQFGAPYTMPIGSLLEQAVIPLSPEFGTEPRRVLREFLTELRSGLGVDTLVS
jgi:hypothetical protein